MGRVSTDIPESLFDGISAHHLLSRVRCLVAEAGEQTVEIVAACWPGVETVPALCRDRRYHRRSFHDPAAGDDLRLGETMSTARRGYRAEPERSLARVQRAACRFLMCRVARGTEA